VAPTKIALTVEYDGTSYHGFQLQCNQPTIQGELEDALWKLTQERIRVVGASRTDAGVHAKGQMVSFRATSLLSLQTFIKGLNYYLPRDIAVKAAYRADESFDVRRSALSREYNYHILNSDTRSPLRQGFTYHVPGHLNTDAMNQACQALIGVHDFASFASCVDAERKNMSRAVYKADIQKNGEMVIFNMVASSFLPHQVRNTIGSLIQVGQGRMTVDEFCSIMEAKKPGLAGPTIPACGLCLMRVDYSYTFKEEVK
jgi:tRNA pseudouridine38-40 synthase